MTPLTPLPLCFSAPASLSIHTRRASPNVSPRPARQPSRRRAVHAPVFCQSVAEEAEDEATEDGQDFPGAESGSEAAPGAATDAAAAALEPLGLGLHSLQVCAHTRTLTATLSHGRDAETPSSEDCAKASSALDAVAALPVLAGLCANENDPRPYTLQVTTPGAPTRLEHDWELDVFRSFPVRVALHDKAKKDVLGTLAGCDDDVLRVSIKGRVKKIKRADVASVVLVTASDLP